MDNRLNILFCSVGRRCELLKDFRKSLGDKVKLVVTDNSPYAPALAFADVSYQVPLIQDKTYIPTILKICRRERINAVTTLIDPEIAILAEHREAFEALGITVLAPYQETAALCFDKYEMAKYLVAKGIPTIKTYGTFTAFQEAYNKKEVAFPVFVKPRTGSGSVGARRVDTIEMLEKVTASDPLLVIQEFMDGEDMDADIYVDTISHKPVAIFTKKKISTTIGGANKTISFRDDALFTFIKEALSEFAFNGPLDMDLFYQNGQYYLSEINPRFGGAYLHAYGAGIDFPLYIYENVQKKKENTEHIGDYQDEVVMMMYDSVVIETMSEINKNMVKM